MLVGRVPVPASRSCCDRFDVNIGIAADPTVEAPIDSPDNGIPQAAFMHRQMHDGIIVGFVVENDGDNTVVARRPLPPRVG
jgi:hypothetical protein